MPNLEHETQRPRLPWTREHRLIALNLYHKLPFARLKNTDGAIIEIARLLGRSPTSVAMKVRDFAALDPFAQTQHSFMVPSIDDRRLWLEFGRNTSDLPIESERLLGELLGVPDGAEIDCASCSAGIVIRPARGSPLPEGPTEEIASVKVRRGQNFFRQAVLTAYGGRCSVTGLAIPELLVASHIRPWRLFPEDRLDPQNGLCLSRLHDGAFDQGLITFDADLRMVLSDRLLQSEPAKTTQSFFGTYEGQQLRLPDKLGEPNPAFLEWHRREVFLGK